jgi:uncharacterized protein YndB with AHSA1/START domain
VTIDATYYDVVPKERIVYTNELHLGDRKFSGWIAEAAVLTDFADAAQALFCILYTHRTLSEAVRRHARGGQEGYQHLNP